MLESLARALARLTAERAVSFLPSGDRSNNRDIPNGIPAHVMPFGTHDLNDFGLLFLADCRLHLHDCLKQVLADVLPLRHLDESGVGENGKSELMPGCSVPN